jgi:hypothetical protein
MNVTHIYVRYWHLAGIDAGDEHVCFWHLADIDTGVEHVRFWGQSGHP